MNEWIEYKGDAYCKFCQFCVRNNGDVEATPVKCPQCRNKFAIAALTGILASQSWQNLPYDHNEIAVLALNQADAMMNCRFMKARFMNGRILNARSRVPDAS